MAETANGGLKLNYKRTVVVFQPHTYTRTAALFDDFVTQLRRPPDDVNVSAVDHIGAHAHEYRFV